MNPTPLTDDERDQIARMNADGSSLRDVARALGRSTSTISRHAATLGLTWDRAAHTAAATAAASADNKSRRVGIVARLYVQIENLLDRLEADSYSFTATTGQGIETVSLAEAPAQEVKALIQGIGTAATSAAKLEAIDSDNGAEGGRSMLAGLLTGLRVVLDGTDGDGFDDGDQGEAEQGDDLDEDPPDAQP